MNLSAGAVDAAWLWIGNLTFAALVFGALRTRPWRWLDTDSRQHACAGAIVACMVLWSISGRLGGGPGFHILGTTILTLMFGPRLALAAAALVLLGVTLAGRAGWEIFGLNAILMGAVPIATSYAVFRWADRRLPNHFFVYVLVSAFVNGALAMSASRLAARLVLLIGGTAPVAISTGDYLIASVLLAWGEALTTGMIMTIFVVYRPGWVMLFDDRRYLFGR